MRLVLDVAVEKIAVANRTPATKARMAERILRAASEGVRDPIQLTVVAVEDGMQPAD
jgi:phenylpyruvate tautomerase PptA (4-oxalocrotonate tautomerase family)